MSNINNYFNQINLQEIIETIQKIIQIKGFSGSEQDRVNYLIGLCKELGYNSVFADQMGNLIAEMKFGTGFGKKIILTGHLDTVGADSSGWDKSTQPFEGIIKENKIYGRGAADMLGSVCAMIYAIYYLKKASYSNLNGTIYFIGTVCEEFFEGVAFLEALKKIQPDYVIIGEATECKINIGQRGRAEIVITSFGQLQHSSTGRNVINAIEEIAYVIDVFNNKYKPDKDDVLGERIIVPTDIQIPVGGGGGIDGRGGNSTVPSKVVLTYDMRTLVGDDLNSIFKLIQYFIKKNIKRKEKNYRYPEINFANDNVTTYTGITIKKEKFAPAWKTDKKSIIVSKAIQGLKQINFNKIELSSYGFCTDGSAIVKYQKLYPDKIIEIIGFGPGKENYAHTVNEFIEIFEIKRAFLGFSGIINKLLE